MIAIKTAVELERDFDNFFNGIGYKKVTDIVGSPHFENSDYIDLEQKITIELKVIDKDFFSEGGIIHRLKTIVTVPKNTDEKGFGQYEFTVPPKNREGISDSIEEPLRRTIKKANRQIKETKNKLMDGNGIGFLLIALNIRTSIDPEKFRELTGDILSREFSSINGFIICTPTWGAYNPITGSEHPLCLPTTPFGAPNYIRQACLDIGEKWTKFGNNGGHK